MVEQPNTPLPGVDREPEPHAPLVRHHRFFDFTQAVQRQTAARLSAEHSSEEIALGLMLRRVNQLLTVDAEQEVLKPAGFTWATFRVCVSLWVNGPQQPGEVAAAASMSRAGVSIAMKQLLATEYLVTRPSDHDRRAIIMELTEAGTTAFERAFAHHLEITREWLELLSVPERQQLLALLGKIMLASRARSVEPGRPLNA